jgi:hypothetical protein
MFYLDVTGAEAAEGAGELVAEALPALPFDFSLSFLACVAAVEDEDEALLLPDEEELVPPLAAADGAAADVTALEPAAAGELLLLLVVGRLEWLLEGAECELGGPPPPLGVAPGAAELSPAELFLPDFLTDLLWLLELEEESLLALLLPLVVELLLLGV